MTDRELLEMAAKAAGIEIELIPECGGRYFVHTHGNSMWWNPLTDDGDALRLAVKLGICYGPNFDGDTAVAFGREGRNITEDHGTDPYAATRRAIVRAAAAIGEKQ
jgi:hypothetical protein